MLLFSSQINYPRIVTNGNAGIFCCHTYPNDKLLQLNLDHYCLLRCISCHTYPNDKLLQLQDAKDGDVLAVVILTLTISFYNTIWQRLSKDIMRCHTYPNDKLLQPTGTRLINEQIELSYLP